ncbi:MAG: hypothetical protein NTX59_12110 [Elusimicrobia bacterium]|nr:hypothetical protein [Elusimicrobiota bacterium]
MKVIIPPLDCLWNDVIHMSLMHPSLIYRTLSEIGFEHHKIHRDWFEIPLCNVAVNSILYKNDRRKEDRREFLNSDFEPVSVGRVKELSGMPEINIEYYRECLEEKQYPLMWGYAPHLLLKGKLNVTNYRVFDWREDV